MTKTRPECKRCEAFGPGYCDGYEYGILRREQPEETNIPTQSAISSSHPETRTAAGSVSRDFQRSTRVLLFPPLHGGSGSSALVLKPIDMAPHATSSCPKSAIHSACDRYHRCALQIFEDAWNETRGRRWELNDSLNCSRDAMPRLLVSNFYKFALQEYGKFITGAKEQISIHAPLTDDHMRRTALIACLLVVCIENLQFRYAVALTHAQKGLRVMQEYIDTAPERDYSYGNEILATICH